MPHSSEPARRLRSIDRSHIEALRVHLRADKLTLWGISYGSHLTLAAIKELGPRIDRAVLASVEGLDQTVKRPARTDAYFARLQHAIDTNPDMKEIFPDIVATMRNVHARLEVEPVRVSFQRRDGAEAEVLVQPRVLREFTSGAIADPRNALRMMSVYQALEQGETRPLAAVLARFSDEDTAISFRPMSTIMDVASGITTDRRAMIEREAETGLLKSHLNFVLHLLDVTPELDLGDSFREDPVAHTPVLVLSGTLDGRTYIESQLEATSGLTNRQAVEVRNAGHNLFMATPEVTTTIQKFMRGENVDGHVIDVELPNTTGM